MTTPSPSLDSRLLAMLDAIDEPVSIATAIRDRDERILDFRLDFVNQAAAEWAGVPREAMIGLITGELLPEFRSSGFFDTLADAVTGGDWVGGIYDMRAIRLGDGYMSTWRRRAATPKPG